MRTLFLLSVNLLFTTVMILHAQDKMPQAVSYQAVARDAQGKVVAQKAIGIQVEILKGSTTGAVVFSETHSPTSSQTGTVNLLIGQGTRKIGTFSSVDWGADTYYLQLSMDLSGGSNYEKVSTTQMLPVPYALYARYAERAGVAEDARSSGSSSENVKFVLIKDDDNDDDNWLHNILLGNEVEGDTSNDYPFELDFSIVYLNGINQELNAVIEEWPEGTVLSESSKEKTTPSSPMGRFCAIRANMPKGRYNLKLLIKNKTGITVKEYPFVLNMKDREY
ncbi:hypothetical protein [Parabacteroides goldsteinii]|uniref:hypothetical protein n=1 Tax=Parabacteroides goldsteinii TaxID=328812 RepID=UPI001E60ADB9|nr:hypothetical protein [Parabacteroides goldsteinii]